jgi:hypothetical protein
MQNLVASRTGKPKKDNENSPISDLWSCSFGFLNVFRSGYWVRLRTLGKGRISVVDDIGHHNERTVFSFLARDSVPKTDGRMTRINYKPFIAAGFFWAILSVTTLFVFLAEPKAGLIPFFTLFVLVALDLFFLGKTVAVLSVLLSDQLAEKQPNQALKLVLWGMAKMAALGALMAVTWNAKNIPTLSLLLGIGSLIVIPVLGGLSWSWIEEFKNERSRELDHAR